MRYSWLDLVLVVLALLLIVPLVMQLIDAIVVAIGAGG